MKRIALISTPRSGNSWVRSVLAHALHLEQITAHNPRDLPASLPRRLILQIHWYREPRFQAFLREEGFQIVVLARHPLDVLLSVLHFARYEPEVARWLEGNAELPAGLTAATPTAQTFRNYATGWGAENLLGISYQWWHDAAAVKGRYEDLARAPAKHFGELVKALNGGAEDALDQALSIDWLKVFHSMPNRHGWHGRPGLWRELITADLAWRIFVRHYRVFRTLGYAVPATLLSRRAAERNWRRLAASDIISK